MLNLIYLEMKNNRLFYMGLIPITLILVITLLLNHVTFNFKGIESIIYYSIYLISPIAVFLAFTNEKWGFYLTLPVSKTKQLLVKLLLPLISSILYGTIIYIVLSFVEFSTIAHKSVYSIPYFAHLLIVIPTLIMALYLVLYLYTKTYDYGQIKYILHSILFLILIIGYYALTVVVLFNVSFSIHHILWTLMFIFDGLLFGIIRYYYGKVER